MDPATREYLNWMLGKVRRLSSLRIPYDYFQSIQCQNLGLCFGKTSLSKRLRFLIPQSGEIFDSNASLAAALVASASTLWELKSMIGKKNAVIVPGVVGDADVRLSSVGDRYFTLQMSTRSIGDLLIGIGSTAPDVFGRPC